jgi:hypothetical protein
MNIKYIGKDKIYEVDGFKGRLVFDKDNKRYYLQNIKYSKFGESEITYKEIKLLKIGDMWYPTTAN